MLPRNSWGKQFARSPGESGQIDSFAFVRGGINVDTDCHGSDSKTASAVGMERDRVVSSRHHYAVGDKRLTA